MMVKVTTSLSWMEAASSMSVWVDINFINYLQFIESGKSREKIMEDLLGETLEVESRVL